MWLCGWNDKSQVLIGLSMLIRGYYIYIVTLKSTINNSETECRQSWTAILTM